jgi:hypothetical protein
MQTMILTTDQANTMIDLPTVRKQLADLAGIWEIRWAIEKQIVQPIKVGTYTLLTTEMVEALRQHFKTKQGN